MKKSIVFLVLFVLFSGGAVSAKALQQQPYKLIKLQQQEQLEEVEKLIEPQKLEQLQKPRQSQQQQKKQRVQEKQEQLQLQEPQQLQRVVQEIQQLQQSQLQELQQLGAVKVQGENQKNQNLMRFDELERKIRDDFRLFLDELYTEREMSKKEAENIKVALIDILGDAKTLISESRKEIKDMSYSENRNLLIASIFLWISITIFIAMNLVFANNLKKELYFLRNGLLRSEIKDNMINLSNQLNDLNEKLELINRSELK